MANVNLTNFAEQEELLNVRPLVPELYIADHCWGDFEVSGYVHTSISKIKARLLMFKLSQISAIKSRPLFTLAIALVLVLGGWGSSGGASFELFGSEVTLSGSQTITGEKTYEADQNFADNVNINLGADSDCTFGFDGTDLVLTCTTTGSRVIFDLANASNNLIFDNAGASGVGISSAGALNLVGDGITLYSAGAATGGSRYVAILNNTATITAVSANSVAFWAEDIGASSSFHIIDEAGDIYKFGSSAFSVPNTIVAHAASITENWSTQAGGTTSSEIDRGTSDTDITYIALRNADGTLVYIYPNPSGEGVHASTAKP
ncbi:hypothetical protein LCGC14_1118600 [marine sediment metagenome]|uniref:Uncharacterized protein n=1 Tax=marine sediment metagenome TaxID=412755 RepID=A0A0F9MSK7_9ZZZZ